LERTSVVLQSPIIDLNSNTNCVSEQQDARESAAEIQRLKAEVSRLEHSHADLKTELNNVRLELRASQASRMLLAAEISRLATEKVCALQDKDEQLRAVRRKVEVWAVKERRLEVLENTLKSIEHSSSWRLTRPLRNFMAILRRIRGGGSAGPEL
jgi:chromosome segregation ATPase